jgi:hypothetical protein
VEKYFNPNWSAAGLTNLQKKSSKLAILGSCQAPARIGEDVVDADNVLVLRQLESNVAGSLVASDEVASVLCTMGNSVLGFQVAVPIWLQTRFNRGDQCSERVGASVDDQIVKPTHSILFPRMDFRFHLSQEVSLPGCGANDQGCQFIVP